MEYVVIGGKYGTWTPLRSVTIEGRKHTLYECQCVCGTTRNQRASRLLSGAIIKCRDCYLRSHRNSIYDILLRLEIREPDKLETGCWVWTGRKDIGGYGDVSYNGRYRKTHKIVYEHFVGDVPEGVDLHHQCDTPACCNFEHLSPLTRREHIAISNGPAGINARKTHCKRGHEFTEENTVTERHGRSCRACKKLQNARCRTIYKLRQTEKRGRDD